MQTIMQSQETVAHTSEVQEFVPSTGTETFGIHLMLDGYEADVNLLKDKELLFSLLENIPTSLGMHNIITPVVKEVGPKNRKDPGGISGVVMIAESHLTFHTFPARGFVTIDLYTCQNDMDTEKVTKTLVDSFKVKKYNVHVVKRGVFYPSDDIYTNPYSAFEQS